jgi:hypothetical protein
MWKVCWQQLIVNSCKGLTFFINWCFNCLFLQPRQRRSIVGNSGVRLLRGWYFKGCLKGMRIQSTLVERMLLLLLNGFASNLPGCTSLCESTWLSLNLCGNKKCSTKSVLLHHQSGRIWFGVVMRSFGNHAAMLLLWVF